MGDREAAVGEIHIEIFDLGAPVRGKPELRTGARGPARVGAGLREAKGLAAQFAERQTGGAIEQDIVERIAGAATQGAEPRVREFPGRESVFRAGGLDVAFDAENPQTGLPVVASLRAARQARRPGTGV